MMPFRRWNSYFQTSFRTFTRRSLPRYTVSFFQKRLPINQLGSLALPGMFSASYTNELQRINFMNGLLHRKFASD